MDGIGDKPTDFTLCALSTTMHSIPFMKYRYPLRHLFPSPKYGHSTLKNKIHTKFN